MGRDKGELRHLHGGESAAGKAASPMQATKMPTDARIEADLRHSQGGGGRIQASVRTTQSRSHARVGATIRNSHEGGKLARRNVSSHRHTEVKGRFPVSAQTRQPPTDARAEVNARPAYRGSVGNLIPARGVSKFTKGSQFMNYISATQAPADARVETEPTHRRSAGAVASRIAASAPTRQAVTDTAVDADIRHSSSCGKVAGDIASRIPNPVPLPDSSHEVNSMSLHCGGRAKDVLPHRSPTFSARTSRK